ncbi:hypothetical protein [Gorillibacterium sp. sgz5001074]|uniref:hypothetical protein n=1 Tax=Gorillibacterium sp. sgz5001074 TaxID=3446695 RepID=UPI003F674AD2
MRVEEKDEDYTLPPRRTLHPSGALKWTRRFYAALVILFALLIAALASWFYWSGGF